MQHISTVMERGPVRFPEFLGERVYMAPFTKKDGVPDHLKRWQPTVDAMLEGVEAPGRLYLMIDQAFVAAGTHHRRPGLHIDGYWRPTISAHSHTSTPRPRPLSDNLWDAFEYAEAETILIASDVLGSVAFDGVFDGSPAEGGDCSHIDTTTMLHESLAVNKNSFRTLVRINVPGFAC